MDLKNYSLRKKALQNHFLFILILLSDLNLRFTKDKLQNDKNNLINEKFSVVIIGEFSRGKSTFVNAMLGRSILPSSKQPTTNIISKIIYGEKPTYTLHYKEEGRQPKQISDEEFLSIKAQAEPEPSNLEKVKSFFKKTDDFSKIKFAEIAYPLSFCRNGVEVVDTPGTNDLNVGRMEITYEYLQHAEAAILILGADQALSKSEKEFLRERVIGNQIQDIFIVVNYKDQLNGPDEEKRVKQYVLDNLSDLGDFSKRIFLVSSKQALLFRRKENGEELKKKALLSLPASLDETGFPQFEESLAYFLSEEKGLSKLKKYVQCCHNALDDIENDLKTRKEASTHSADELRQRLREARPRYQKTKEGAERVSQYLRSRLLMEEGELLQKADITAARIKQAATQAIDGYQDGMNSSDVQYLVDKAVTPIQKQFITDINEFQQQIMQRESKQAIKQLKKLWADMDFSAESLPLSSELAVLANVNVTEHSSPEDIGFGYRLATDMIGLAAAIITGSWIVGFITILGTRYVKASSDVTGRKENIRQQVKKQYDQMLKNFCGDISKQYRKSVDMLCSSMQTEVDNRLETMEQQLRLLINAKESKERDEFAESKMIEKQFSEVKKIRANLAEVLRV